MDIGLAILILIAVLIIMAILDPIIAGILLVLFYWSERKRVKRTFKPAKKKIR